VRIETADFTGRLREGETRTAAEAAAVVLHALLVGRRQASHHSCTSACV